MGLAVKQDDDAESIKDEDVQMKPISGGPEAKNGEPDNVAATSFGISNGESEMEKKSLGKEESNTPNTPNTCLLYTSPSPRDRQKSRMPSSA